MTERQKVADLPQEEREQLIKRAADAGIRNAMIATWYVDTLEAKIAAATAQKMRLRQMMQLQELMKVNKQMSKLMIKMMRLRLIMLLKQMRLRQMPQILIQKLRQSSWTKMLSRRLRLQLRHLKKQKQKQQKRQALKWLKFVIFAEAKL